MPDDGNSIGVSSGARLDQSYTHSESAVPAATHALSLSLSIANARGNHGNSQFWSLPDVVGVGLPYSVCMFVCLNYC